MKPRSLLLILFVSLTLARLGAAPIHIDEESPWPRVRSTNGHTVTLHLPQVERWTSNSFTARAAVEVQPAHAKSNLLGVIWFDAHGSVDHSNRVVTLDNLEIVRGRFPEATDNGSNAMSIVRDVLPAGARTVSLDYLITALGFERAAARQGSHGISHTPPAIIWATNRSVLVLLDGKPVLRAITNTTLERVVNTPALLVFDKQSSRFYLNGQERWFSASAINGPWSLAQSPPAQVAALAPAQSTAPANTEASPRIILSTSPSELVLTADLPDFRPIRGTKLQYAADTDSQLFYHTVDREAYVLLSGRWFKAKSLQGPWTYVSPHDLPPDFARIPASSAQAVVLASVPGTPQAELALLANSVPTTTTVNRKTATLQVSYDGEPKFKPIEGTALSYALNAQLPVIRKENEYYALDDGVWFLASAPAGPWEVATEVPEEIYTIPPSSPVYYATYANVYQVNGDEVEVGYTPGYQGAYEDDGTVVYGTGSNYEPWCGDYYYGWGWTWGYGYCYFPWYNWWMWRPSWNEGRGLWAANMENIYDRWQDRPGIAHHDRPNAGSRIGSAGGSYPTLYGRFGGASRPGALVPPANTLSLNPWSRPQSSVHPGQTPRGAELLSSVRQSPGGGRDLYASPDGGIYRRNNDGWYRRQANGKWDYVASARGEVRDGQLVAAGGNQGGNRKNAGPWQKSDPRSARGQAGNWVPNSGFEPRSSEVAALEREYAARSLAQSRAQNARNYGGGGGGGGRRNNRRGGLRR